MSNISVPIGLLMLNCVGEVTPEMEFVPPSKRKSRLLKPEREECIQLPAQRDMLEFSTNAGLAYCKEEELTVRLLTI